jgi:arsenate reductase
MATSKKVRVYQYAKCSTCRDALKFLDQKKVPYEALPIVENPPTLGELKQMLAAVKKRGGGIKNLFNTSGILYREMKIADKLKNADEAEVESQALALLTKHGMLVKRPFLISSDAHLLGFKADEWKKAL